jgi:hypothetical protein
VVAVYLGDDAGLTPEATRTQLFARLIDYKVPSQTAVVDAIPVGATRCCVCGLAGLVNRPGCCIWSITTRSWMAGQWGSSMGSLPVQKPVQKPVQMLVKKPVQISAGKRIAL